MHPLIQDVQKSQLKRMPEVKAGYTVRVHQKIKEGGKERVQVFEGLVIRVAHGTDSEKTFTVRKMVEGIGVEKIFPIHSANLVKIEVRKKAKVRRSKLYYMRERSGKSARMKERHVTDQERAEDEKRMNALIDEAVQADEARKAEAMPAGKQEAAMDQVEGQEGTEENTDAQAPEVESTDTPQEEVKPETPAEDPAPETTASDEEEKPAEEAPAADEEMEDDSKKEEANS